MEETRDGRTWHKAERWETSDEDCDFLYGLVRAVKPNKILETGTWKGKSARAMVKALRENGHGRITTVEGEPLIFYENSDLEWDEWVKQEVGPSPRVLAVLDLDGLDLAFLDSSHDFATVYGELCAVHPHLEPGGYIAVHDILYYGTDEVRNAIRRFMSEHPMEYHYVEIASYAGIGLLRKLK